jgi:hypothetical protein
VTRRFEKNHPILRVAQTVGIRQTKKGQNICNILKPSNAYNKSCFETAYLYENVILLKQKNSPKCRHFFGLRRLFKKSQCASKSSLICDKSPNLVTLNVGVGIPL